MNILTRLYSTGGILGRTSNNLTSGIVGLANVGKSTIFQAITRSKLGNPANYPFATIEPEEAKVVVPSAQLDYLQKLYGSEKKIPATLTVYDIAGLTRNASRGEGLGNKFLADIRHVDGIYSIVRGFRSDEIIHVEGSVDPVRDLALVQDELVLKDLEWLEAGKGRIEKKIVRVAKTSPEYTAFTSELKLLSRLEEFLYEGRRVSHFAKGCTKEEIDIINTHNFLTAKPSLILLNSTPKDYLLQRNEFLDPVKKWVEEYSPGEEVLLISAEFERIYNEFIDRDDLAGLADYIKVTLGDEAPKVDKKLSFLPQMIIKMRERLNLISFYTCGPKESRQWTIRKGTEAPGAAGVIHSDLEKTFICCNVIKYSDVQDLEPPLQESQLRNKGKILRGGKKYVMQDGDIVHFKAANSKN
ncbi:HHR166Wp [Eremothecium sinecaudum]|uniref:Obg-like ATPase homolog n=1 Tax=Eremothecium sinecaudum TaxID=45286 RepID=A0A120K2X7_9SACH|nr:HHR166Wp [Eremothecium sinecaudum]AMD22935.1 HHR166Wp [Eremothecium sinecaudum]